MCVRGSTDKLGLSLTSREVRRRPCPCCELSNDLRDVPVRLDVATDRALDVERVRFELVCW
jgi:hypothetical protein